MNCMPSAPPDGAEGRPRRPVPPMPNPASKIPDPKRRRRRLLRGLAIVVAAPLVARLLLPLVPMPAGIDLPPAPPPIELLDRHGSTLRIAGISNAPVARPLAESDIPQSLVLATLAAEDARFRSHPGFDPLATARAAWQWVRNRRVISGASTLTQQLVKLCSPTPRPRTLRTKVIEVVLASRLETEWDKDRILRAYLARIDYGNRCTGITEAARHYFAKAPSELSLAESAFLAGIPQAPTRLNPRFRFERTRKRQEWILGRCLTLGWIDASTHAQSLAAPIRLAPLVPEHRAPHFAEWVLPQLPRPVQGGRIPTTLDLPLQERCEAIVRGQLARISGRNAREAAVVVLDNASGGILALVGSPDWTEPRQGQVNGALARRSPGSALKPFAYLLAVQDGATAADIIADIPSHFATATGVFAPLNYDRRFRGPVPLREALANSLNIPAVRLLQDHGGAARLLELLGALHITTLDREAQHYGLGLVLGDGEVRLLELANAYAALARLGEWRPATPFPRPAAPGHRVAPAPECWLIADILSDPLARAESFGLDSPLHLGFPVAAKTGTSSGFRDNWAFGFVPEFTVGVWVGNFDGTPMRDISGVTGAAPILREIFEHLRATRGTTWYTEPSGIVRTGVSRLTGRVPARREARDIRTEVFLHGRLPAMESVADRDPDGRVRLDREYADWFPTSDNRLEAQAVLGSSGNPARIRILEPAPGTVFLRDADQPASSQRIRLRANTPALWNSSTLRGAGSNATEVLELELVPGTHRIEARSAAGAVAETWIEVRDL